MSTKPGKKIGFRVEYDPFYFYFTQDETVYRIRKKFLLRKWDIRDKRLRSRIRAYHAKLRERIATIPSELFEPNHIYCVHGDGEIMDHGELIGSENRHGNNKGYLTVFDLPPDVL